MLGWWHCGGVATITGSRGAGEYGLEGKGQGGMAVARGHAATRAPVASACVAMLLVADHLFRSCVPTMLSAARPEFGQGGE